jgi:hypothetical protein
MARVQSFSRSIQVLADQTMSPQARSRQIATIHRNAVAEAENKLAQVFNTPHIPSKTWVDGKQGAPPESVNPDRGKILTQWEMLGEIVEFIDAMLVMRSPVGPSGNYARSHQLFADGVETDPEKPAPAETYIFISRLPYSRKVERGQGSAPDDGVYEGAVEMANRRFGNLAWIKFGFQAVVDGAMQDYSAAPGRAGKKANVSARYPAIRITMR